jgi:hypothetical protein
MRVCERYGGTRGRGRLRANYDPCIELRGRGLGASLKRHGAAP